MSRTLTAMFDTRADAEAAQHRLKDANIDISHVSLHDQSSAGHSNEQYSTQANQGFWGSIKGAFLPDEDRHTYEEGVRRGGVLLTAQVDEDTADKAVRILEDASTVDIDERSSQWRSSGWDYQPDTANTGMGTGTGMGMATGMGAGAASGLFSGRDTDTDMSTGAGNAGRTGMSENEESIPIVQEQLAVGKREVERGGVRVRSYVVETPVHESVQLREEHVEVERRAVDLPLSAAGDAFRERSIEMTETSEEAVIAKNARVVEEVVVRKDVGERTETIDDTVRRTEVDVENVGIKGTSGTGFTGGTTDRDRY